jgi:microcystin-dependent protein
MADQTAPSGKVHRKGAASERKRDHQHKKKGCHSAPEVPANVELRFRKRNEDHKPVWRGIVKFDPVTVDVAARPLDPERYDVELRAVDASGDPVETHGQEVSTTADGADFIVDTGSTTVVGKGRRLENHGTKIKKTLTGLTTGIEFGVDCYARKSTGDTDATIHFAIWDTFLGTEVAQKNGSPDTIKPKVVVTLKHTPVVGHGYEIRATYQSGTTGKPIIEQAQWHDNGDAAVWRHRLSGDADPLKEAFPDLAKPKVWYYSARCRAMNRVGGARCYSAWSAWTAAANPATGDPIGPPAPDGLSLTFHREEARKKSPFQVKAVWNELPWWIPPDGEPVEGADRYAVRLAVSEDGGSSTVRTRRVSLQAKDDDADQTAFYEFNNIRRRRHYRISVRAFKDDRRGAWSAWSVWKSPKDEIGNGPNGPLNVDKTKVKPGVILFTWDEPTNGEDVDYYRVRVYCQGNLRETRKTRSEHYKYIIPDADRGTAHSAKVTAVDEDGNLSPEVDSGSDVDTTDAAVGDTFGVGDIRKLAHLSVANWLNNHPKWLRCNGNQYATASYPDLFAEIGYTYGGSGSTFAVPDMNNRHPVGTSASLSIGADEALAEASRMMAHAHAQDETNQATPGDFTYADTGTGDQQNTPGGDATQEATTHSHNTGIPTNAASGTDIAAQGGGANSASRMAHTHEVQGYVQARDQGHQHQNHSHGNHGHNHGHNNQNHHHGHGHANHKHQHQHDNKQRPHKAVHFVIKALA